MPKIRHTDGEPVWLFDRDPSVRHGWVEAFVVAAVLAAASVGGAFARTPWALAGLPPALFMAYANLKRRDVHTYGAAFAWMSLVGLGMAGSLLLLWLSLR